MQKLKLKSGMSIRLTGSPQRTLLKAKDPQTVAIAPKRIPYIKPRVLVKEGDRVKIGTPLVEDKRNTKIKYLSPGGGLVEKIDLGPRRTIREIVIRIDGPEGEETFSPMGIDAIETATPSQIAEHLMDGGMWQFLRALPFGDTADATALPPMIIVSLAGVDMFSPKAGVYLKERMDMFRFGIKILNKLSPRICVAAPQEELAQISEIKDLITLTTEDRYPAGNPGVVLYGIKKSEEENGSWCINGQELLAMAEFMSSGKYPIRQIVTSAGCAQDTPCHIETRVGAPVSVLTVDAAKDSKIITGGLLNGYVVSPHNHMGYFERAVVFMPENHEEEFLGFIRPGIKKVSESTAFLSALRKDPMPSDCNMHGELRACVNCGKCSRICPVDLLPQFIMKAGHADEIEEALALGLLDCVRCGLCTYVCPSKIELSESFEIAIQLYYKDRG